MLVYTFFKGDSKLCILYNLNFEKKKLHLEGKKKTLGENRLRLF